MKKKITAIETFLGSIDKFGQKAITYEKGKIYEVPSEVADLFVHGKLPKPYEAPKPPPAAPPQKPADAK